VFNSVSSSSGTTASGEGTNTLTVSSTTDGTNGTSTVSFTLPASAIFEVPDLLFPGYVYPENTSTSFPCISSSTSLSGWSYISTLYRLYLPYRFGTFGAARPIRILLAAGTYTIIVPWRNLFQSGRTFSLTATVSAVGTYAKTFTSGASVYLFAGAATDKYWNYQNNSYYAANSFSWTPHSTDAVVRMSIASGTTMDLAVDNSVSYAGVSGWTYDDKSLQWKRTITGTTDVTIKGTSSSSAYQLAILSTLPDVFSLTLLS
jgi:hypothetical protein